MQLKIGYTNGVFDLFHMGHMEFLEKAKGCCDYLIVAVCEDQLAFKHKGKYPIMTLNERIKVLEGVKYIDKVVIQSTTDRISEWEKYHFDVIFHGIDGKKFDVEQGYYDKLSEIGVSSIYFELDTYISTTAILNRIKRGME